MKHVLDQAEYENKRHFFSFFLYLLLRDKLLHDLVENYAEITPKLHAKNATPPTPKIGRGAKRRGQFCAPPVSRFLRGNLA